MAYRAYVYRLYPTTSQEARLDSVRETCRRFYNDCLGNIHQRSRNLGH